MTTENHLRGRLPFRVTPALTYCGYAPNTTRRNQPEGRNHHEAEVSTHRLGFAGPWSVREYPPVHPFDYACRPRLSSRLTLGGLALPRKPRVHGGRVTLSSLATHASILTPMRSTVGRPPASPPMGSSPTDSNELKSRRFGVQLSPVYCRRMSTRPVSCYALFEWMAASKPTSWLSGRTHILCHSAGTWGP